MSAETHNPASPERKLFSFVSAVIAIPTGLICWIVGFSELWDQIHGRGGSGEWSGLGTLFALIVCIPGGLIVLGLSFATRPAAVRWVCRLLALVSILLPVTSIYARQRKREQWRHQLEEDVRRHSEEKR